jgi:hypothetical protein
MGSSVGGGAAGASVAGAGATGASVDVAAGAQAANMRLAIINPVRILKSFDISFSFIYWFFLHDT